MPLSLCLSLLYSIATVAVVVVVDSFALLLLMVSLLLPLLFPTPPMSEIRSTEALFDLARPIMTRVVCWDLIFNEKKLVFYNIL